LFGQFSLAKTIVISIQAVIENAEFRYCALGCHYWNKALQADQFRIMRCMWCHHLPFMYLCLLRNGS